MKGVFEYEDQKLKHYFVAVDGARPNLLIVIDWPQKAWLVNNVIVVLNSLSQKYSDVSSPGLSTMKGVEACKQVDKEAKPIFYKAVSTIFR